MKQLCAALNVDKRSVDRDLDVYRNLLSKLVQAKELLKEYVARYNLKKTNYLFLILIVRNTFVVTHIEAAVMAEKKKREERSAESQKASEAVKNCLAQPNYVGQ